MKWTQTPPFISFFRETQLFLKNGYVVRLVENFLDHCLRYSAHRFSESFNRDCFPDVLFERSGEFVQTFDLIDEPKVKIITFRALEYSAKRRFAGI